MGSILPMQVVYVDSGQAAGAQAGFKGEIQKKEDRLRRDQVRNPFPDRAKNGL